MTNWMTVTGVAMILGGIGIPIWFRREIFGVGGKRRVRASRGQRAIEAPRRAQLTAGPAHAAEVPAEVDKPLALSAAPASGPPGPVPTAARRFPPARTAGLQVDAAEDVSVLEVAAPAGLESPEADAEAEAAGSSRRSRRGRRRGLALAGTAAGAATEPRAATEAGSQHGRTAGRDAADDLDDRDSTGRFRYGLASIGLADDDIRPADDDMDPADDDVSSAGDDHDISPGDADGHGVGLAGADDHGVGLAGAGGHDVGLAIGGGCDEAYAAQDGAVHHDVEANRDVHDQHEVGRDEDESPDVINITDEAAAEAPWVSPEAHTQDGRYLDDHGRYLEEPDEPDVDKRQDAAPLAMPRTWSDRRYGDRVDGWVRPQYHELPQSEGAYWTPVPEAAHYAGPFGWPIPVDRLPAVPDYEPATGFDLTPVGEPTAVVTQWPPAQPATEWRPAQPEKQSPPTQPAKQWPPAQPVSRPELSRSWSAAGGTMAPQEQPFWVAPEEDDERRPRRRAVMIRRGRAEAKRRGQVDPTQALPPIEDEAKDQRPRPRPRPSTVYVSKHAAE